METAEQQELLGISYTLVRKQVKRLNLRIRPDGSVMVSAHPRVPLSTIQAFLTAHAQQILAAQEKFRTTRGTPPQERHYLEGDLFYILGKPVTLTLTKGTPEGVVRQGDTLSLTVKDLDNRAKKERLVGWYLTQLAQDMFTQVATEVCYAMACYHIPMPTIRVRNMKSRWGSCHTTKATIVLSTHLVSKPLPAIQYVVLHEFCHFIHPNHSKDFYSLVAQFMPDWKTRKGLLS